MQSLPIAQIKAALRKEQLRRLRSWAKSDPAQVAAASRQVCDHVYDYIIARYRPGPAASEVQTQVSAARQPAPPLLVLAYLPLYFEVDLVPLLERLWPIAQRERIHVLTPVVLSESLEAVGDTAPSPSPTPRQSGLESAMVFIEVLDEADLEENFVPSGAYRIREFSSELLHPWLRGPTAAAAGPRDDPPRRCDRERRLMLCDAYARLFPASAAAGHRPRGLLEYTEASPHTAPSPTGAPADAASVAGPPGGEARALEVADVLVLTPGVLFDRCTGARLGKGGGFYDRFLAYHNSVRHRDSPATDTAPSRAGWEVMAIAFDAQVLPCPASDISGQDAGSVVGPTSSRIPFDAHDQLMHAVATPSGAVERVRQRA
ncbi:5-formyltetrahydrofolate cyclo-ligase family [Novymonas esmeraldas]|uniref:5-formyltetrahydrofolate cyclo-ligase n=1 Tax=Novymonas esmeraldas TaxID=1808958 RepID=A0AAW0EV40_9TRYP